MPLDKITRLEKEILAVLSLTQWKTGRQIIEEIIAERKKSDQRGLLHRIIVLFYPSSDDFLFDLLTPSGIIYLKLHQFEEQKLLELRPKDCPPEVIEKRGGHPLLEFRLTESGRRIRAKVPSKEKSSIWGWLPHPV